MNRGDNKPLLKVSVLFLKKEMTYSSIGSSI